MIMLKKTEQMITELNHIISRVNCIFWDEERTLSSIYADSYRLEIMIGNLCVDRPINDANIKRFVRRLPVPDQFHEYVEYELKRSTPTIIDVKEELLQFCENRSQLNDNRVIVERIINKMYSVSEKCKIEFTEQNLVSTDGKLLLEIKLPLIRSLIAALKQELYNAINDVCEIYGDANEALNIPYQRKYDTDEVKLK